MGCTWQPGYPDPSYPNWPLPNTPPNIYTSTDTNIRFHKVEQMNSPELYPEDLDILKTLLARLPTLAGIQGISEIELRVRMNDERIWAVIGYGEAGDPCVLRFESN